jgi:DNA-binding transcriptional LysR family regulator
VKLQQLRCLVAVAEELHFGRAATRLRMAQPPLTRQIQALEAELGFLLLDRSRRKVELTAAGAVMLRHARRMFEALEQATDEARRASLGQIGRIRVAYPSSLTYSGLTDFLRAFRVKLPDVEVALQEMPPQEQIDALREGRVDVGFVRAPLDDPALSSEVLRREPLVVALPCDHPMARRARVPLDALAGEAFVFFPRKRGSAFFDQLVGLCRSAGFAPNIVQEAPLVDILNLVAAGFGISIVPLSLRNLRRAGIKLRPLVGSPTTELLMAWATENHSPVLLGFLEVVRQQSARMTRQKKPPRARARSSKLA